MKKSPGFSLIEVLIVLSLISLIVGLTVNNFSFLNRRLVRSEVDKLYSVCMFMQRQAMATNSVQTLQFNRAANSYIFNGQEEYLVKPTVFGFIAGAKGLPATPQREISSPITFQQDTITFHPDGIIKPGSVYLVDSQMQSMYALSSSVAQVSFLRVYRYKQGSWQPIKDID